MYSVYSKYYDKIEATSQEVVTFVLNQITKFKPEAKSILEIGCGTGNNLISLKEKFEVHGLDISKEMLTIAKNKLPDTKFFIGDMANFNTAQKYDAIISLYDSINHLDGIENWKKCFESSYKHLNSGGLFIFDVNTLHKLNFMCRSADIEIDLIEKQLKMKVTKVDTNTFNWEIKVVNQKPGFSKQLIESETIVETAFELTQIQDALRDCQFEILKMVELNGNPADLTSNRVYFVCRKIS